MDALPFQKPERPLRDPKRRAAYRRAHPACEACGTRRSVEVHHLVSRQMSGSDEDENLLALCTGCHRGWTGINRTRAEWLGEHERTMTEETIGKVRRALRME